MPNLVGIGNSQVPTNAMLGGLAYQDSVGEINIEKIKARISDTATTVFVYDTRKDSDGGAWRHRTQHTSWYNESASATRGARKEFPSVAVIVAETQKLTIYDGDDPNLPMWMHFEFNNYPNGSNVSKTPIGIGRITSANLRELNISSVHMLNGFLFIGGNRVLNNSSIHAGYDLNFISEVMNEYLHYPSSATRTTKWRLDGNISQRNSTDAIPTPTGGRYNGSGTSFSILGMVNDVAMIVESNAAVDPYTKLPVPTLAVATHKGTTIVRGNGIYEGETVADVVYTGNPDTQYVDFRKSDNALVMSMNNNSIYVHVIHDIPTSNKTGSQPYQKEGIDDEFYRTGSSSNWNQSLWVQGSGATGTQCRIANNVIAGNGGINVIVPNRKSHTNGMVADITHSHNSGYMFADCRGAFLSSTDTTNNTNHITNHDFTNGITGWTTTLNGASGGSPGITVVSNKLRFQQGSSNSVWLEAYQDITTVVGKKYIFNVDVASSNTSANWRIYAAGTKILGYPSYLNQGQHSATFVATGTSTRINIQQGGSASTVGEIHSASVHLAEDDHRNSGAKGLQVYGTMNRFPVAAGAELVAYQPASSTSYVQHDTLNETGINWSNAWYMMFWYNVRGKMSIENFNTGGYNNTLLMISISDGGFYLRGQTGNVNLESGPFGNAVGWNQVIAVYNGSNQLRIYKNGKYVHQRSITFSNINARVILFANSYNNNGGSYQNRSYSVDTNAKMALARVGLGEPSQKFISKMYHDEVNLFQENAKCTLHGTSDTVKGLAFDDTNDIYHVGTSAGRSEIQGLNRINNTTTAVTTAISASNGFVAEQ